MSESNLQDEEREVLASIYDGDECFKQLTSNIFQYKYGENDCSKSFLLEIRWGDNYPNELPDINLDTFYNKHVVDSLKSKIVKLVTDEAQQYLGMSMTYSLFEYVKEHFDDLIKEQPETIENINEIDKLTITEDDTNVSSKREPKKEQLTKAQKRRQWNRVDGKGEKPRGWNWVDVVKHLSQTGVKETVTPTS